MPCIILHKYKKSNILWKKTLESLERWVVSPHLADRLAHLAVYFTQLAASLSLSARWRTGTGFDSRW